ncbi:MAG: toll/interleukin-1 receptor domain-containing protein [Lachnospiraceae bacterium]|nr:toll/interleukin-1 receptor domain-containing protein [Lachnospiraceae bacterium]
MHINEKDKDPDIFISYSSANKNIADKIVSFLEGRGLRCWYAPRDILPGTRWVSAINTAVNSAKIFLLVFTDRSNDSRQVANEVALAFNAGKIIIPFKCNDIPMNPELEYYLTRVHWFDAVGFPERDVLDDLGIYINKLITDGDPASHPVAHVHNNSIFSFGRSTALITVITIAVIFILLGSFIAGSLAKKYSGQKLSQAIALYYGYDDADKDHEAALELFEKPAEKGDPAANYYLGCLEWDKGNDEKANDCFSKSMTAGNPLAKVALGVMSDDPEDAKTLGEEAVLDGCPEGNYLIGAYYADENRKEFDPKLAKEYFEKAAQSEDDDWQTAALSGLSLLSSMGDDPSPSKIKDCADKASKLYHGCEHLYADSACRFGTAFRNIDDPESSLYWYKIAGEAGNAYAMNELGLIYLNGDGDTDDPEKAFEWFKLSAEAGDPYGMYNLAYLYESGIGTDENTIEAINWYKKAAEEGNSSAAKALDRLSK